MEIGPYLARLANVSDCYRIMELYHRIYRGNYRDPLIHDAQLLRAFLLQPHHFWLVAELPSSNELIASVILRYDPENRIAKAFGAVVLPEARGGRMMEKLLAHGIDVVRKNTVGVEVVYATTRTVHEAAQALTEKLGFRKLGIFPNSHKNTEYETHCLTALYFDQAVEKRFRSYSVHHELQSLLGLVTQEVPEMGTVEFIRPEPPTRTLVDPPILEVIESIHFIRHRFESLRSGGKLQFAFFPFHEPNLLITSPDQSIEIFCFHSREDGYSVIIGGKVTESVSYTSLFNAIANLLRGHQARYVELLVRADKPKIIDSILKAKFIPSAFFPAFQLHAGMRYDYVVLTKTFETFDFQNVHLKGMNQRYLEEYVRHWMRAASYPLGESRHPSPLFSRVRSGSSTSLSSEEERPALYQ